MEKSIQSAFDDARGYIKEGNFLKAITILKRAEDDYPKSAEIQFELGNAYRHSGNLDKTAESFKMAVKLKPDFFSAYFNLGSALKLLGQYEEAIECFEKAKSLQPDFTDTYLSLGLLLNITGKYDSAIEIFEQGIACKQDRIEFFTGLAESFIGLQKYHLAEQTLTNALQVKPDSIQILNGLGNLFVLMNDLNIAKDYYYRALMIKPDFADAHYNLGNIMRKWNRLDEAEVCYRNALKFSPGNQVVLSNLGECALSKGDVESALSIFRKILEINPQDTIAADNILLSMNYDPDCTIEQLYTAHSYWGDKFKTKEFKFSNSRNSDRPLKIGYLSPDFCKHPSASILLPVFRNHDSRRVHLYAYSQTVYIDEITSLFKTLTHEWRNIENLDDEQVCELVKSDEIDILVDCAGHMSGNRLGVFALKPAPLQISGVGYPNTTGLRTVDFRISDNIADPLGETVCHSEELLRLSCGFCCYEPLITASVVHTPPSKESKKITFGSTHTLARLNKQVIKLWSEVLKSVEDSRLLIFRNTLCGSVMERLKSWFIEYGIEPGRIEFKSMVPNEGHLTIYNSIDVLLDTFPWSGHVTACESLFMGVPVITLMGNRHAARMVSSILYRIGLPELIARSKEEYIKLAQDLADNSDRLFSYRVDLREKMLNSQLCNYKEFVKCLEDNYFEIWKKTSCETV